MTTKEKIKYVLQLEADRQALNQMLNLLRTAYKFVVPTPKERAKITAATKQLTAIEMELKRLLPTDEFTSHL